MSTPSRAPHTTLSEFELIDELRQKFARVACPSLLIGIGDDAAVLDRLAAPGSKLVWTVDDSLEGVHFRLQWLTLDEAAARAFHAAASDLAAMGARPVAALSSLEVPRNSDVRQLQLVGRGQLRASQETRCPIIGGNVTRGTHWRFTTTLLGSVEHAVARSSARPGHTVWLLGNVGLAGCGRTMLQRRVTSGAARESNAMRTCLRAFRRPKALLERGSELDGRVHSCIDLSDGLAADAAKLASASSVQIVLQQQLLRAALSPALRRAAHELGEDPLRLALWGGEDYALLVTGPEARRPRGAKRIGEVSSGSGASLAGAQGLEMLEDGFDHLRPAS